ncbi:hypothetical protein Q5H80_17800 [Vibrio sp. SNU_ST1]|uniref:hypothetical protein n=1 Tax=Vibrio sp. SNU_ST1 TaxID=3064001 RepID=UPI00272A7CC8|nr:hypothetical protein [Vibrio sp. SNU_ST1]WKY60670.1 hypothetical protein Q5H80_17800 [Vibrio sp. SNU_ST1]
MITEKLEYTLKAVVAGAGAGVAATGGLSFIPAFSVTLPVVAFFATFSAAALSLYTYSKARG